MIAFADIKADDHKKIKAIDKTDEGKKTDEGMAVRLSGS